MEQKTMPDGDLASRCRAVTRPGLYSLIPRANRVMSRLADLAGVDVQVLTAPPIGARFAEYELFFGPDSRTHHVIADGMEHFFFVLEGAMSLELEGRKCAMTVGGYAAIPPNMPFGIAGEPGACGRALWLRRRYIPVAGLAAPGAIVSREQDVTAISEDTYLEQRLIPLENVAFDMGVNILSFDPGVHFGFAETHVMEHGLYMLQGRGIYWLNGDYHEAMEGDFIYMAPFCPQFFYATGWERSRYLIYKDVNRDYTEGL